MRKSLPIFTLIIVFGIGAGVYLQAPSPSPPEQAPETGFSLINGERIDLADLRGTPVLIQFWATSCPECRREIPDLRALYNDLQPRGLRFIAVAMPYDPPNRVLELADTAPLPYSVALDINGDAVRAFGGITHTPTTLLISPEGKIVFRKTGPLDFKKLRNKIKELLATRQRATGRQPQATGGSSPVAGDWRLAAL